MTLFRRRAATALRAEAVEPTRRGFLAGLCACCLGTGLDISPAAAQAPAVQRHIALARAAAGEDLRVLLGLLAPAAPELGFREPDRAGLRAMPAPTPKPAFDNLIFVGNHYVTAWAIPTSDGIILIDALNNDEEAETQAEAGLRRVGLDPAQVKTVIVTHGHADHYGGANWFARRFGSRVVMHETDWTMMETQLEYDRPDLGRPPRRDVVVQDGAVIRQGDTTIEVLLTPGHTWGTISLLLDVRDGSRTHRAMLWGGTAFNFGRMPRRMERIQAYIDSTTRAQQVARQQGVDVFLSNHTLWDEAVVKLGLKEPGKPNPFVIGQEATERALTVMRECALATQAAWSA
jgi:metallo-beta-lactamase class B